MNYDLRTSTDFGLNYFIVDSDEDATKLANKCRSMNDRRWVVTDKNNKPIFWCSYIESALSVPSGTTIATDDLYVTIVAKEKGIKTLTSIEVASLATGKSVEELKKVWKKATPQQVIEGMKDLRKKVKNKEIKVLPDTGVKEGEIYGKK